MITFSLGGGGAQRVMTTMANYWRQKGWSVTIIAYGSRASKSRYEVDSGVDVRFLAIEQRSTSACQAIRNNVRRLKVLRREIKLSCPSVVISFLHKVNVRSIIACCGLNIPVIVSERTDPVATPIPRIWRLFRRWSYRYATYLVTQTGAAKEYFAPVVRAKTHVIPNPITQHEDVVGVTGHVRQKSVIAMGRLVDQKGFDLLLCAFARLSSKHAEWKLVIWGEGRLRSRLESVRDSLGLQGRAFLAGWTDSPMREMQRASLFVLPSRYEGFPNALCEAMACGLPVISFDCRSGPSDIIRDSIDGLLVRRQDVRSLSEAMDRLMADSVERERLGKRSTEVLERFNIGRIMEMWKRTGIGIDEENERQNSGVTYESATGEPVSGEMGRRDGCGGACRVKEGSQYSC